MLSGAIILVLTVLLPVACSRGESATESRPLLVLAASDLQHALPEIVARYRREGGHRVEIVLGSTGSLTTQIQQGAPADLFLAANERFLDRLEASGRVVPGTRRVYATGRLAAIWRRGTDPVRRLDDLRAAGVGMIAIANPEHAPYGQAAIEALGSAGLLDALRPRLVLAENVAQAFQFVQTGNADVGLVALGIVAGLEGSEYLLLPADLHQPLKQAGAVIVESPRQDLARQFLAFLTTEVGQEILRRYGFESPGP